MRSLSLCIVALGLGAVLAGCSPPERPRPLTAQAVDAALTPPAMDVLRVQARAIQHPILRPVEVDANDGLTPEAAGVVAVLANPSLRSVRDGRGMSAAQVLQAGLLPNPSLSLGNEFPYAGPDHLIAYNVGISWDISALISHSAKLAAAKATAASVDLDVAWQEWQVAQSAKAAAYKVLSLEAQLALARQADRLLQDELKIIQKAVDAQQKTAVDLAAAQAAQQEAHTTVLETERDLARQRLAMRRLLGPGVGEVKLRPGAPPGRAELPSAGPLQAGLEDRRLDLLALRRGYDSQEAGVRAAVLSRFPKTSIGATHARDTGGVYTFGFDLSVDLPLFDRNQGNIAIEKATRQKLFDEFVNRVYEARSEIASSLAELDSLNRQAAFAESAVPVLERLVAVYEKAVNAGSADVLSYYTARGELNKKKIEVVKLRQEIADGWIALENASGVYVSAPGGAASQPASRPTSGGGPR